jgi:dihydroneopterin aldolase
VKARVGVSDEERSRPQTLRISVEIFSDLSAAATSDELSDTIDYSEAVERVQAAAERGSSKLLEHLAHEIIAEISQLRGITGVSVDIAKDPPPLNHDVEDVSVRIERSVE